MTREYSINILKYLNLSNEIELQLHVTELIIWLRSAKLLLNSKYLSDKGFKNSNCFFAHFNRVRCSRILRTREIKKYDVIELLTKDAYC